MATVRDILMDADAFRRAYPDWPHPESGKGLPMATAAQIRDRLASLTVDDAIAAAAVLAEISAGRDETAERLLAESGLGDLGVPDLEHLCRRHDIPFDDDIRH